MPRLLVSCLSIPKSLGIIHEALSVATHVANPCGHSLCGPCIAEWVKVKVLGTMALGMAADGTFRRGTLAPFAARNSRLHVPPYLTFPWIVL